MPHCRIRSFLFASLSGLVTNRMDLRWAAANCLKIAAFLAAGLSPMLSVILGPSSNVNAIVWPNAKEARSIGASVRPTMTAYRRKAAVLVCTVGQHLSRRFSARLDWLFVSCGH